MPPIFFLVISIICTDSATQTKYTSKWWDIHKKFIDTITTSIFYLNFKENNENDMAAHGICFDFYYRPKPSQIGQNGSAAAADARVTAIYRVSHIKMGKVIWQVSGLIIS